MDKVQKGDDEVGWLGVAGEMVKWGRDDRVPQQSVVAGGESKDFSGCLGWLVASKGRSRVFGLSGTKSRF